MVATKFFHDAYPVKPRYGIYPYWHYVCWKNRPSTVEAGTVLTAVWLFKALPPNATLEALENDGFRVSRRPKGGNVWTT